MNHSLGYGTSSGDLNTGGNLSESSFLEALFGLEFGHADFSSLLFVSPTDFTDFHRFFFEYGEDRFYGKPPQLFCKRSFSSMFFHIST